MTTPLTPELCCNNIDISLSFYIEILGFSIQYQRKEDRFVMLERQGARIMLEEIHGTNRTWLTGSLEAPFGRGMNLEIKTDRIDSSMILSKRLKLLSFCLLKKNSINE